jgi:DNA-binding transcriptional ArsR family regulator
MLNNKSALDDMFAALANPARRAMIERLAKGPASVSELAKPLAMSLPAVVQHLQQLEESGLVSSRKSGRVRTYRVKAKPLGEAQDWLARQRARWEAQLDSLEDYLKTMEANEHDER